MTQAKLLVNNIILVISKPWAKLTFWCKKWRVRLLIGVAVTCTVFAIIKPQSFADLWLTRDQQGMLLFKLGHFQQAANQFNLVRWQAYSLYGAEAFDQSAILYNQFEGEADQIARANALAHARRYVAARNVYQQVLDTYPNNEQAQHNLAIVQNIIDEVNRIAESQQSEAGDSPQELGDDPQTGEGAKKNEIVLEVAEHYDASQLLLDPKLNEMWLRQVQKDPAQFLANKFQMQSLETHQINVDDNLNSRDIADENNNIVEEGK
ncbi:hypothetical protein [uncultured Shewanella sp.]|uniref:hypothetical protein n=1 Tax=uncultured Shewanella sp. TaxID=173975 RepID=UPI00262D4BCF|nr:hypothetical protein [uncultured Shewanella sp.]